MTRETRTGRRRWRSPLVASTRKWRDTCSKRGADPNATEGFFGVSVLGFALWGAETEEELEVAKLVLEAGAEDRVEALFVGLEEGRLDLARAAVASGPVLESEARRLRERFSELEGEAAEVLAAVETRPDPHPPVYSEEELAGFAGTFEDG